MPFPLHKAPSGLLELLRLRTLGGQPNQFAEQVIPTIRANEFYAVDLLRSGSTSGAAGAFPRSIAGNVGAGVVGAPGGPIALVAYAAIVTMGAAGGTQLRIRIGLDLPDAGPTAWVASEVFAPAAAGGSYVATALFSPWLVLPGGARFFGTAESDAAGADHVMGFTTVTAVLNTG